MIEIDKNTSKVRGLNGAIRTVAYLDANAEKISRLSPQLVELETLLDAFSSANLFQDDFKSITEEIENLLEYLAEEDSEAFSKASEHFSKLMGLGNYSAMGLASRFVQASIVDWRWKNYIGREESVEIDRERIARYMASL